jgi:C4-dicarboxylate transporter DctQ subunit
MNALDRLDHHFSRLERLFLGGTIIFTSLLLFVNVVLRYVFHHSIYWAEELVRYLMVWLIFVGGSQVVKVEGQIKVDVLVRTLPERVQRVWGLVVDAISLAMLLVLTWYSCQQCARVLASQQISPALELPMWLVYLAVPAGSSLMALRYLQQLLKRFASGAAADTGYTQSVD